MKKKIAFLASGNGGTLNFLYNAINTFSLPFEITNIITDRDCGAYEFGKIKNVETTKINYSTKNEQELIDILKNINVDIIITNIYKILSSTILNSTKADFINLHYSLLPAFEGLIGMKTVDKAKEQNVQFLGVTCHEVNEQVDAGKILCQGIFPVNWSAPIENIYNKVFQIACIAFLNSILRKYSTITEEYESEYGIFNPPCCFNTKELNKIFGILSQNVIN